MANAVASSSSGPHHEAATTIPHRRWVQPNGGSHFRVWASLFVADKVVVSYLSGGCHPVSSLHPQSRSPWARARLVYWDSLLGCTQGFLEFGFVVVRQRSLEDLAPRSLEFFKHLVRRSSPDQDEEYRTTRTHGFS